MAGVLKGGKEWGKEGQLEMTAKQNLFLCVSIMIQQLAELSLLSIAMPLAMVSGKFELTNAAFGSVVPRSQLIMEQSSQSTQSYISRPRTAIDTGCEV